MLTHAINSTLLGHYCHQCQLHQCDAMHYHSNAVTCLSYKVPIFCRCTASDEIYGMELGRFVSVLRELIHILRRHVPKMILHFLPGDLDLLT